MCMVTGQLFIDDVTFILLLGYFIHGRDYAIFLQCMRISSYSRDGEIERDGGGGGGGGWTKTFHI